jgi:GTP-binding protein
MSFTLAIVGRPNVGKSTIFNRLAGKRLALVHDTPGVTRDWHEAEAHLGHLSFRIIDTAGIISKTEEALQAGMTAQTLAALDNADVALFVVDGREGLTTSDHEIAVLLRRSGKPVILAANKCEGRDHSAALAEAYALGFGDVLQLSAEHNLGFADLIEALQPFAPAQTGMSKQAFKAEQEDTEELEAAAGEESDGDFSVEEFEGEDFDAQEDEEGWVERPLRLALLGRPNVGKSSLFNKLLGSERALTGPEAGTTRDAIAASWNIDGREILLHDTAGLRKRAKARVDTLERMSVSSTIEALKFADCAIMMIDATQPFENQDLAIADLIAREGRAIVFAVNKFDLLPNPAGAISRLVEQRDRLLPRLVGAPLIAVSALYGEGIDRLLPAVLAADKAWNTRLPTAGLNRFLESALSRHAPPAVHGRRVRVRYMTQVKARPPTFAIFGNQLDALPEDYRRYLQNALRETFDLHGTPLRFVMRNSKNPFAGK